MVIVGIDEVGRGCWAGPLVVGAVILDGPIDGIADSKILAKGKRAQLAKIINSEALDTGLGWVWPGEIDQQGLTRSTKLAINRALQEINNPYDQIILDGKFNFLPDNSKCRTLVGADKTVPAVSAASIIAKVARDEYMEKQSEVFPDYGFDRHVGYGTKLHLKNLIKHGPCHLHRLSYKPLKSVLS